MRRFGRWLGSVVVVLGAGGALLSCGGAGDPVVARVGESTIRRSSVDHWMKVLVAGDYHQEIVKPAPSGLVSDPPDYGACIRAANGIVRKRSSQVTATLCRDLYQAVKLQAVGFLTDALWHIEDAKEHGETATSNEVARRLRRQRQREWPAPGQFQRYLGERHLTLADESYLLKRDVLSQKQLERVRQEGLTAGHEAAALQMAEEYSAKWTARTSCQPGYVAEQCKQYTGTPKHAPSPNSVLLQLAGQEAAPRH